jgi:L-arabinonolactonase
MFRIELLVDVRNDLGEGPLWDVDEQRLYWIDSHGKSVHRCDARGQDQRSWRVPEHIGSLCLREAGARSSLCAPASISSISPPARCG